MRTTRDWRRARATHNEVLETLEAVISRHPTGVVRTVRPGGETGGEPASTDAPLAPVVDLRARRELARAAAWNGSSRPDDAA